MTYLRPSVTTGQALPKKTTIISVLADPLTVRYMVSHQPLAQVFLLPRQLVLLLLATLLPAQDVAEGLDPTYGPNTTEDRELFKEKQKYMYAVFVNTLKTDQGKFAKTFDAQSIYRDVVEHALKSTKASISASEILSYVTSTCLGEGSAWRGSTEGFIRHWQEQVRLYETLVSTDEYFSSGHKKNMLQNAVLRTRILLWYLFCLPTVDFRDSTHSPTFVYCPRVFMRYLRAFI
jgi:hypothetical protein